MIESTASRMRAAGLSRCWVAANASILNPCKFDPEIARLIRVSFPYKEASSFLSFVIVENARRHPFDVANYDELFLPHQKREKNGNKPEKEKKRNR